MTDRADKVTERVGDVLDLWDSEHTIRWVLHWSTPEDAIRELITEIRKALNSDE